MDDGLRRRLQDADPARDDVPADSWIEDLVEATMNDVEQRVPIRRRWALAGVAAVAALVVGGGASMLLQDEEPGAKPARELALELPDPDPMMMCMEFSVDGLRPMETAFAATAVEVAGEEVLLDVDRWYTGADRADRVRLHAGSEAVLLEGGITFTEGERYLVTATGGVVNGCGFSAPWSSEMAQAFEEAFQLTPS